LIVSHQKFLVISATFLAENSAEKSCAIVKNAIFSGLLQSCYYYLFVYLFVCLFDFFNFYPPVTINRQLRYILNESTLA